MSADTITPLATVADLKSMYRLMDAAQASRATALLTYASAKVLSYMGRHAVELDANDALQREVLKGVCCSMVRRAMTRSSADSDVDAWGGAVPVSSGDVYMSAQEKADVLGSKPLRRLGVVLPEVGQ